jgi:hypothetical protein
MLSAVNEAFHSDRLDAWALMLARYPNHRFHNSSLRTLDESTTYTAAPSSSQVRGITTKTTQHLRASPLLHQCLHKRVTLCAVLAGALGAFVASAWSVHVRPFSTHCLLVDRSVHSLTTRTTNPAPNPSSTSPNTLTSPATANMREIVRIEPRPPTAAARVDPAFSGTTKHSGTTANHPAAYRFTSRPDNA